ncbi:hypothetical protein SLE2022_055380 [Rubroshorea leprosula]
MNPELWAKLVHLWTEDEGHLRRSSSAKTNRAKGPRLRFLLENSGFDRSVTVALGLAFCSVRVRNRNRGRGNQGE